MAEHEPTQSSITPWPIPLLDAPEAHFWNEYEEHFDGSLIRSVFEERDQNTSTETTSIWGMGSIPNFQDAPIALGLGSINHSVTEHAANSSHTANTQILSNADRFVCNQCNKPFKSQSDLNRHWSSIHDKSSPYLCYVRRCRRRQKGFTRKDNYEAHLRNVHGRLSKDANQAKGRSHHILSHMEPTSEIGEDCDLESYSVEELTEMVINEREKCRMERRRRQEVEEELKNLRKRYEEREDKWLKLLTAKEECG